MMNKKDQNLEYMIAHLHELDEYGALESPSDDATRAEMKDVKVAPQVLNEQLNLQLSCTIVQDASFIGYLSQHQDATSTFSIRFSKFGRLFTIDGSPQSYVDSFPVPDIINLLEDMDFVYVPTEILKLPYTGVNEIDQMLTEGETALWWHRYFFYV